MASQKVEELQGISGFGSDDSVLLVSDTSDNSTFQSKKITVGDIRSELNASAGDGLELTGGVISVDLTAATGAQLNLSGYSGIGLIYNGTYSFLGEGSLTGISPSQVLNIADSSGYAVYYKDGSGTFQHVIAFDTTSFGWYGFQIDTTDPEGPVTTWTGATSATALVTNLNVPASETQNSLQSPNTVFANVDDYTSGGLPSHLAFEEGTGKLYVVTSNDQTISFGDSPETVPLVSSVNSVFTSVYTLIKSGLGVGSNIMGSWTGTVLAGASSLWGGIQALGTQVDSNTSALTGKASSAQGALADTALQPGDNISVLANNAGYLTSVPVTSVASKTGAVTLTASDVGLGLVNNTPDSLKPVSTFQQSALDGKPDSVNVVLRSGAQAMIGALDMGSNRIENMATPALAGDAATKQYVDTATSGQGAFWTPVRVASIGNVDVATGGLFAIDGVLLLAGERVLLTDQAVASENGIYVTDNGAWTRSVDADQSAEYTRNKTVFAQEGNTNAGTVYAFSGNDYPTIGSSDITFAIKQTAAAIADGSISNAKLAANSVSNDKIISVDAAKVTNQGAITITESQISDLQNYASSAQGALADTSAQPGDNVNTLIAGTVGDAVPATYHFLVVDASNGQIKVLDKDFVEITE